jgi:hypothetical protein
MRSRRLPIRINGARALVGLVKAVADASDLDRARVLAEQAEAAGRAIAQPTWRAQMLVALVKAVAGAGDLDRAEAIARAIADADARAQTLGVVVEAAADSGDLDRARALAKRVEAAVQAITNPDARARELAKLARKAAPSQARSLLAQALTAGRWEMSAVALIQVDPVAVSSIVDEYSSATSSTGTSY